MLLSNRQRILDSGLFLGLFTDGDLVTRLNLVRGNIHNLIIYNDGLVAHQLACFRTCGTETHTPYDIIQTAFKKLQQIFTC